MKSHGGHIEYRKDEVFSGDDHEKDASKHRQRLVEQLGPTDMAGPRIFKLIAERWTENVVHIVVKGEVVGIRDVTERRRKLQRKLLP